MACVVITPNIKEIANLLNIKPARAALLAGLSPKSDNFTLEDILKELAKQELSNKDFARFDYMHDVVYNKTQDVEHPILYSVQGKVHINLPKQNPGFAIIEYLKQEIPNIKEELLNDISNILSEDNSLQRCNLLMNYYAMHRIAYNYNFEGRTLDEKELILNRAIEDSVELFNEYLTYSNMSKPKQQMTQQSQTPNLSSYEFYSGAAQGSDTEWANQAKNLGIKVKDYTVQDWDKLSQEWKDKLEAEYQSVVSLLGRKPLDANSYGGKLVRRDMMQADKADAIFAIGTIASNGYADGGTGYATTRGIQKGIPVYLFDQKDNTWKVWKDGKFVHTEEPILTPHAATIGTRGIQENGKQAIRSILSKTFQSLSHKESEQVNKIGGFSMQSASEEVAQTPSVPFKMPQVSRSFFNVADREENPMTEFNRTFTSLEKNEAAEAIATDFSRIVSTLLAEDMPNASDKDRRSYIYANLPRILEALRNSYLEYLNNPAVRARDTRLGEAFINSKLNWLTKITAPNNFEILMQSAAITIERVESVVIDHSLSTATESGNTESTNTKTDDDPESEGRDGWMVKVREVDPRLTLSSRVKKALATIPKGELNIFGKPKMLSPDYVHAVLVNELSNMAYVEDFIKGDNVVAFPALERLATKYSWMKTLLRRLQSNPVLASQFFTDFRKDFIFYTSTIDVYELDEEGHYIPTEDGKPKTKRVTKHLNQTVALDAAMQELITNYDQGNILDDDSIYTAGSISEENRKKNVEKLSAVTSIINDRDFSFDDDASRKEVFDKLLQVLHAVGFNTQYSDLEALYNDANFAQEINIIREKLAVILEQKIPEGSHLIDYFEGAYTSIAEIVGKVSELMNVQSFRAGDKMFYSYSPSNYINTMMKKLKDMNEERRAQYIQEEFKKYEWFFNSKTDTWRNFWLELLEGNPNVRAHLQIENMNVITRLDDDGKTVTTPYSEWTKDDMAEAFMLQYYSIPNDSKANIQYGKYNTPIYSDSPVVNFITMPKFVGEEYRAQIADKLVDVVEQELVRIADIEKRNAVGTDIEIANYDRQGNKFLFFPALNNIPGFYDTINEVYKNGNVESARRLIFDAVYEIMERGADEFRKTVSVAADVLIDNGIITSDSEEEKKEAFDNYYWNQAYATTQIIQLTTTDLAFYKNGVDFQKRYKEVYAAGNKLNTHSKYGKATEKVLYLSDEEIPSVSLPQIEEVLKQAVSEGRITALDEQSILSKFKKVNVADAQAYRSISSMRSVLDMMGQWTDEMEKAVDKFEDGTWTIADFSMIWQTIKPFMFTQISDTSGGGLRKVPHQNKNSEFLLLAMHSLIAGSNIGRSPVLRALNTFMENNNIDVVMFESAVKAGNQTTVTITDGMNESEIEGALKQALNSPTAIKEFNYEDYVIQQPTPEHLIDHLGIYGSQFRNLIVSDISDDALFMVDGIDRPVAKAELLNMYQSAIVENLLEDYARVKGKFESIETLQKALLETIKGNPKYGSDIAEALQIVDGKFNIPLYNPSTTEKLQEIINSFFKTAITKQQIKGGNAILVSDFGFVDELKCVYGTDKSGKKYLKGVECYMPAYSKQFYEAFMKVDKDGNEYLDINEMPDELKQAIGYRIPTEGKYSMVPLIIKGFLPQANGSAIMLPADITVHAGSDFDVDKMFLMLPEFKIDTDWGKLEKAILLNEGFKKWGKDNVRMTLDMIKNGNIAFSEGTPEIHLYDYYTEHKKEFIKVSKTKYDHKKSVQKNSRAQRNNLLIDISRSILTNPDTVDKFVSPGSFDKLKRSSRISEISENIGLVRIWKEKMLEELPEDCKKLEAKIAQTTDKDKADKLKKKLKETKDKLARVTKLTLKENDIIKALLDPSKLTDDDLKEMATNEERDPLSPLTFMYFHEQNMTGGALIGMYANNTTLFSKFQSYDQSKTRMRLTFDVKLNGVTFGRLDSIISPHGEIVSKNCAEFSAASVDNVKDPVLAKLMQNTDTANITALMLRMGMSVEEIGLLFTQPIIKYWCQYAVGSPMYGDELFLIIDMMTAQESVKNYYKTITQYFKDNVLESNFSSEDLLRMKIQSAGGKFESLLYSHTALESNEESEREETALLKDQLRVLLLMDKLYAASQQLNEVTQVARADSPNGAMAITIAGNIIQKQRVANLKFNMRQTDWMIEGVDIYDDRVKSDMSADELRRTIMSSRFPMLQAFYSLGIDFGESVMKDYFIQYDKRVRDAVDYLTTIGRHDTLQERQLNDFFNAFIKYELSGLEMFGGEDFNDKRDFYLTQYPARFMATKAQHPELAAIGILQKINLDANGNLQFEKSGRLTAAMKDAFMRELDSLMYGSELEQQVAMDLFSYAYYKDGFNFGPNNFGNFFSSRFITNIPSFVEGLRNMETSGIRRFFMQYLLNNLRSGILQRLPYNKPTDKEPKVLIEPRMVGDKYIVTMNSRYVYNSKLGVSNPYFFTTIKNPDGSSNRFLCERMGDGTGTSTDYRLIPEASQFLAGKYVGARYNKNMSAEELATYRGDNKVMTYHQAALATPVEYISDVVEKSFTKLDAPVQQEEKYGRSTNENLENICK